MAPFNGWGSTVSRLQPLRGDSLLFTIQFPLTCNVRNAVKYWIILYRKSSNNVNVVSPTFHQWWLLCDCYFLIFNIVFIHRETFAFCFVLFLLFFGGGGEGISDLWIYCFFNCNTSHFLYVASVKVTSCLRSILTVFSKQPNIHQICIENSKKNGKWQDRKTKKCFQDNILSKEELRGKKSK